MSEPVTQKRIAQLANVNPSTVSLAFSASAKVLPETRDRILELARRLGYRRDPMLGALAAYRQSRRPLAFQGVLGWLGGGAADVDGRRAPLSRIYFESARRAAEACGYNLEVFDAEEHRANPRRLEEILVHRDVRGLLIGPEAGAGAHLALTFARLAAVALDPALEETRLHLVTPSHFANMRQAVRELRARGYRRIGYAIPRRQDEQVARAYSAGFLAEAGFWSPSERVCPYHGDPDVRAFDVWLGEESPDVLVVASEGFAERVVAGGLRVPQDIGIAQLAVSYAESGASGMNEESAAVAEAAVARLVELVESGEWGPPARPQRVLIGGSWVEGRTLRPGAGARRAEGALCGSADFSP